MRRTITIPAAIALALIALTGCSAGSSSDSSSGGMPAPMVDQGTEFSSADGTTTDSDAVAADRQVITTGYVTITVDDPMASANDAVKVIEQAGGDRKSVV